MSIAKVASTFTETGQSAAVVLHGKFNMSLSGTWVATVALERSFDDGVTWLSVETFQSDTEAVIDAPEYGVQFRLNATAFTSGTVVYRLSQ